MVMAFWSICWMARWSGVCDVGVKETEWERQMASESEQNGVVGGDQFFETGHDVVLVLGLGA